MIGLKCIFQTKPFNMTYKYCTVVCTSKHSCSISPTLLYFWVLRNQPMSSVTAELQSCVFVARFLLSFSPLEKENSRKTAVIAARPVTAQRSRGVGSPGALLAAGWAVAALLALNWSSSGTSLAREDYLLAACLQSAEKLVTMTTYCCVVRFFWGGVLWSTRTPPSLGNWEGRMW